MIVPCLLCRKSLPSVPYEHEKHLQSQHNINLHISLIIKKTLKERRRPTANDYEKQAGNEENGGIIVPCLLCRESPLLKPEEHEKHLIDVHKINFHIPWIFRKTLEEGRRKIAQLNKEKDINGIFKEVSRENDKVIPNDHSLKEDINENILICDNYNQSLPISEASKLKVETHNENLLNSSNPRIKTESKEKRYKCEKCGKQFSRSDRLKCHKMTHTGEKPFKCDVCEEQFSRYDNLKRHKLAQMGEKCNRKKIIQEKKYVCDVCGKKFPRSARLKNHKMIHNGENDNGQVEAFVKKEFIQDNLDILYDKDNLNIEYVNSSSSNIETNTEYINSSNSQTTIEPKEKRYKCEKAYENISMRDNYNPHPEISEITRNQVQKHNEKVEKYAKETFIEDDLDILYDEDNLNTEFINSSKSHIKTEPRGKEYKCEICSKQFSKSDKLKRHFRIHSREKTFKCKVCEKQFSRSDHLYNHKYTHSGGNGNGKLEDFVIKESIQDREYKCDKQFLRSARLETHKMTHNEENNSSRFEEFVKKEFIYQDHLDISYDKDTPDIENVNFSDSYVKTNTEYINSSSPNTKIYQGEKSYKCETCGKQFAKLDKLERHFLIHTREKPFTCDICDKSFKTEWYVASHKKNHLSIDESGKKVKPYPCNICGKLFKTESYVKTHQKSHTSG